MNNKVVKLGIVGLGRWSKVLTAAAKDSDSLEIVAGFSRSQEKRDEFTAKFGIKTCESLESLLNLDEIEGLIITVPNEQHYSVAKKALGCRHCRKPITSPSRWDTVHDFFRVFV
jgi:predicted dehydrogenase